MQRSWRFRVSLTNAFVCTGKLSAYMLFLYLWVWHAVFIVRRCGLNNNNHNIIIPVWAKFSHPAHQSPWLFQHDAFKSEMFTINTPTTPDMSEMMMLQICVCVVSHRKAAFVIHYMQFVWEYRIERYVDCVDWFSKNRSCARQCRYVWLIHHSDIDGEWLNIGNICGVILIYGNRWI